MIPLTEVPRSNTLLCKAAPPAPARQTRAVDKGPCFGSCSWQPCAPGLCQRYLPLFVLILSPLSWLELIEPLWGKESSSPLTAQPPAPKQMLGLSQAPLLQLLLKPCQRLFNSVHFFASPWQYHPGQSCPWQGVLVSQGCDHKVPQTGWLHITRNISSHSSGSSKSGKYKRRQSRASSNVWRAVFPGFLLASGPLLASCGVPRLAGASLHLCICHPTLLSLWVCLHVAVILEEYQPCRVRAPLLQLDLLLISYVCSNPISE